MSDVGRKQDIIYNVNNHRQAELRQCEERQQPNTTFTLGNNEQAVDLNETVVYFSKRSSVDLTKTSPTTYGRNCIFDPTVTSSPLNSTYGSVDSGPFSLLSDLNLTGDGVPHQQEDSIQGRAEPPSQVSTPTPSSSSGALPVWAPTGPLPNWSLPGSGASSLSPKHFQQISKQNSLDQDDSLGILSPDQMADFTISMDSTKCSSLTPRKIMNVTHTVDNNPKSNEKASDQFLWSRFCGIDCSVTMLDNQEFPFEDTSPHDSAEAMDFEFLSHEMRLDSSSMPRERQIQPPKDLSFQADKQNIQDGGFSPPDISDRTISPEDLPLDTDGCEQHVDLLKSNDVMESVELTGSTSGGPSSSASVPPAVNSFVASVTSITSLDNGYQGDGEWSRPASRGADHSPTVPNRCQMAIRVKPSMIDPMTDSDFFTESDADAHDELSAMVGGGRGDRKAQVIDGTLYGSNGAVGNNGTTEQNNRASQQNSQCKTNKNFIMSTNEEMESSGVYSDLEKRPEDQDGFDSRQNEYLSKNSVDSPDSSSNSMSDKSANSQVQTGSNDVTLPAEEMNTEDVDNQLVNENNLRNQSDVITTETVIVNETVTDTPVDSQTTNEKNENNKNQNLKTVPIKEANHSQQVKKFKMPKRNVASKIKAMIECKQSGKENEEENQENRRPPRPSKPAKKGGRWDAVMNKIALGQADNKLVPSRLKEVKSKVFAGISLAPPSPRPASPRSVSPRTRSQNEVPTKNHSSNATRFIKENSLLKSKSRCNRTRTTSTTLHGSHQRNGTRLNSSTNSSSHSSNSDISTNQTPPTVKISRGGSKKREAAGRPTSPLSDGSTNSSTIPRTPQQLPQTRPPPPHYGMERSVPSGQKKQLLKNAFKSNRKHEKLGINFSKEKNGTSNPPPTVVELKTPPVRKVPSRRTPPVTNNNNSHSKPAPLKDHNRQQQQQPTAIVKSVPETRHNSKKAAVNTEVEARNIASRQLALALPHLKHGSLGFEALAVLLQYLMFDLDAFSTPKLKNDLEKIKNEWLHTKLELEEGKASYRRLEDTHKEEVKSHEQDKEQLRISLQDLEQLKESHQREIIQLRETYEAEVADLKLQLQQELKECKEKYERILSDSEQRHKDKEDSLTQEWNVRMKELRDDHHTKLEKMQDECTKKNEELQKRLSAVQEEYRVEWRKAVEKMQKDRDSKIQVTAGRCKELEDEVQSLQTVVDLRSRELQESRKQISILSRFAEELPAVQQRAQTLQARVEDLQAQLKNKVSTERQLSEENKLLLESYHQESKQKKRISLHNEELQYKLKQREEYMLAALSGGNLSTQSLTESFRSPIHHSTAVDHNTGVYSRYFQDDTSPPSSPKIKSFVEKSDSIAYVLEIDEDPEEVMSRLVRKAGSFRGISNVTPKNNCSPARARTLPPPKRPRNKGTSLCLSSSATTISPQTFTKSSRFNNTRCRSRSVSADAAEDGDYMNWVPQNSTSRKVNNKIENYYKIEANQNILKNGNAYHEDNECDFDFSESRSRDSLLIDDSLSRMLPSDSSNEADSPSKCSSSGGSSHEGRRHKKSSRHKRKGVDSSLNLVSSTSDLAEPQVLPLPPLPGTGGDRKFLTANLTRMPKESGGEAMISEEISDDENNVRQVNSSSDEQSNSDGEEQSSSSESSLEPEPIKSNSGVKQSLSNHQNISTSKLQRLLLSDSGSPSAATTAMDMSWSEDMDLMPSE